MKGPDRSGGKSLDLINIACTTTDLVEKEKD
jgi:hypothetical protein